MDAPLSYGGPRTALPRPQSKLVQSRLPSIRPTSTYIPRAPSPEARPPQQLQAPAARQSMISRGPPPLSYSHRSGSSIASSKSSTTSRHDSVIATLDHDQFDTPLRVKTSRLPSQQENAYQLLDSPEAESDGSDHQVVSPVRTLRRPARPSLSDRTMESLSSIPPSPAGQRRASFFNQQSPMPQSRPGSAIGYIPPTKLNHNSVVREKGFVRPPSPSKRPVSSAGGPPGIARPIAGRSSISSGTSKTALPTVGGSPHKRALSTIKPPTQARPALSGIAAGVTPARQQSVNTGLKTGSINARPTSMQVPAGHKLQPPTSALKTPRSLAKPASGTMSIRRPAATTATTPAPRPASPARDPSPPAASVAEDGLTKSSAALRAQIAKAKAAARSASLKSAATAEKMSTAEYSFETCDDPFNQGQKVTPLGRRIDTARRDGRLNIAALGLKNIPTEVMQMYDAEAMKASAMSWSETVDLVRFNAADNQIDTISDDVFPDLTGEELIAQQDAKGNQFEGIEHLDLHGNLLKCIPMGLRRLERLTVLNLSRNKMETGVFDVLRHMTGLRELHLQDNELTRDVPESIGQLSRLEVLNLQGNKLTSLPGSIRNLVELRIINLSNNRFAELPIGSLFSLPALREVYAASNALTGAFFPMTVDIVRSLQILDISNNSLASISFGTELHLPAIQVMNVARNRLFAMPNVASWTAMVTLLAEENGLSALPDGFTSLNKLRTADFQMNSLRTIEPEIANMDNLDIFGIAANPLRDKKLLTMGAAEIKEEMRKKLLASAADTAQAD